MVGKRVCIFFLYFFFSLMSSSILVESANDFFLEAFVGEKRALYPGEKTEFSYKISFKEDMEIVFQDLPLLEPHGFRKLGEKSVFAYRLGEYTIQEVKQKVEAVYPGIYRFNAAIIEGAVRDRIHRAEVPPLLIEILDFPEENRPRSFNGMLGDFSLEVNLLSPREILIGDRMKIEIIVRGKGELSTVGLADFFNQEEFKRDFHFNDFFPVGEIKGDSVVFVLELSPLSSKIKQVPAMELSSYDPVLKKYKIMYSDPIAVSVAPLGGSSHSQVEESFRGVLGNLEGEELSWDRIYEDLSPIEILENHLLSEHDLFNRQIPLYPLLFFLGGGGFFLHLGLHCYMKRKERNAKRESSEDLLCQVMKLKVKDSQFYALLERALLLRLFERKHIPCRVESIEELSSEGMSKEVRMFFNSLEERRFSSSKEFSNRKMEKKVRQLCMQIDQPFHKRKG